MTLFQNRDVQTLLPLTVKQIKDAFVSANEKSEFVIDGVDVNNVGFIFRLFSFLNCWWGFWLVFVLRLHLWGWSVTKLDELRMLLSFLTMGLDGWIVTSGKFSQGFSCHQIDNYMLISFLVLSNCQWRLLVLV